MTVHCGWHTALNRTIIDAPIVNSMLYMHCFAEDLEKKLKSVFPSKIVRYDNTRQSKRFC